jgi:hypothetical protein
MYMYRYDHGRQKKNAQMQLQGYIPARNKENNSGLYMQDDSPWISPKAKIIIIISTQYSYCK